MESEVREENQAQTMRGHRLWREAGNSILGWVPVERNLGSEEADVDA